MNKIIYPQLDLIEKTKWEEITGLPGVYIIENVTNGKIYVGCTAKRSFEQRWHMHVNELSRGRHYNKTLQHDWNEDGSQFAFTMAVTFLGPFKDGEIFEEERLLINRLLPEYNSGNSRRKKRFIKK